MSKVEIMRAKNLCAKEPYGLDHLCMDLFHSETLLVLGNCSSGKEILQDVLLGKQSTFQGKIFWEEEEITSKGLREIIDRHEIFYASPNQVLIENQSIAENIYVIRGHKSGIMPGRKAMKIQTRNLLEEMDFYIAPNTLIKDLEYFDRLLVCLMKAVSYGSKVIVFDYIDQYLQGENLRFLQRWMEKQKQLGTTFLIFGEKYDAIDKLCDRVLIMSDGRDKKLAPAKDIKKHEIPFYWLGEAYSKEYGEKGIAYLDDAKSGSVFDERRKNILGIFDKDWGNGQEDFSYFHKLYEENEEALTPLDCFFDEILRSESSKKQFIFIENREYDKLLKDYPLSHNLLIPRNIKELLSMTSKTKEEVMVEEFYHQFAFLKNRSRSYSDYFFYRLVAIYRYERFKKNLMILDNIFLRLDVMEEKHMRDYILQLAEKTKVILISHRLQEVNETAGTVLYVEDGKISQIDTIVR